MSIDASTLTRNIKPLVAPGFLTQTDGVDARSRLIAITDAGRKKRGEAQRHWRNAQEHLNALLGIERVNALHALIDESIEILGSSGAPEEEEDHE